MIVTGIAINTDGNKPNTDSQGHLRVGRLKSGLRIELHNIWVITQQNSAGTGFDPLPNRRLSSIGLDRCDDGWTQILRCRRHHLTGLEVTNLKAFPCIFWSKLCYSENTIFLYSPGCHALFRAEMRCFTNPNSYRKTDEQGGSSRWLSRGLSTQAKDWWYSEGPDVEISQLTMPLKHECLSNHGTGARAC